MAISTVFTNNRTQVSNNVREFERVPGLVLDNWV